MAYLPDSNIVLRLVQTTDPLYQTVSRAIDELQRKGETIVLVPQILVEFWVVATPPANVNGLGMTTDEAEKNCEICKNFSRFYPKTNEFSMNGK